MRSLEARDNSVESCSSVTDAGEEEDMSDVDSCVPFSRNSSCRLISLVGQSLLLVVEVDDTRPCSYAALERSDSSKEKLLVWCRKL